jgi:hypothetical protein
VTPPPAPSTPPGAGAGCPSAVGRPPTASTGPAKDLVTVGVAAGTPGPGDRLTATATLVVRADGPRIVLRAGRATWYVLRGDTVVATARGAAGADVPLPLTSGRRWPAQTLPDVIRLVGCSGGALAPGSYHLVAVVGYGSDPLNGNPAGQAGSFDLVSAPVAVAVP